MRSNLFNVRKAFSLVEMMVVLLILAVVLAIVVPALSAARNTARKAATNALMNGLANACAQFQMDERRLPGYFTARDVGAAENASNFGFSTMNNIILELSGGIVPGNWPNDSAPPGGFSIPNQPRRVFECGPLAANRVKVDTTLIGSSRQVNGVTNKAYFNPDPKFFMVVTGKAGDLDPGVQDEAFPDVVDSWGTPILAWQQDETPNVTGNFSSADSGTPAKFYWGQNAAYLRSLGLGKFSINQSIDSVIGAPNANPGANRIDSLRAVLGTPTFTDPADATRPADARAKIVFQSAGYNSTYCGRSERGGKLAAANGGTIPYTSPADTMEAFDDLLAKVSN